MTANGLKQALFSAYGGFADLRFKDLSKASRFIVDFRRTREGNPKVYGNSCLIYADVIGADEVRVILTKDVPRGPPVTAWACQHGHSQHHDGSLTFNVTHATTGKLRSLAAAFYAIVARGKRYDKPHYKYSCPRTADSLEQLATVLERSWSPA